MSQTKAQLISDQIAGNIGVSGTITTANLVSSGIVSASGDVTSGGNITGSGNITGGGNLTIPGNISANVISGEGTGLTGVSPQFASAVGVKSEGYVVGTGITQLNFTGAGNTFSVDGDTVNIGIRGTGLGIQSGGYLVGTGVTQINFLGAGNTFSIVNDTVNVKVGGDAGGGGDFNSGISTSVKVLLDAIGRTIYKAPANPTGSRYIVRSILATNVAAGNTEVNVVGTVDYFRSVGSGVSERSYIAYHVPIPTGGAVEILPQPIVINPSDEILLRSSDYTRAGINSAVHTTIAIEEKNDTDFFGNGFGDVTFANSANPVGAGKTTPGVGVYVAENSSVIQSIRLSNKTDTGPHLASVYIIDGTKFSQTLTATGTTSYNITGTDRNGSVSGYNSPLTIRVGDTLELNNTTSHAGHPVKIRLIADTGSGGTEVSNPSTTGTSIVSWTPNVPGTYYYQCDNHNDMVGTIVVTSLPASAPEKYLVKNLIIPKYASIEILDKPKRLEENNVLGIGLSTGQSIHAQISGKLASE